MNSRSFWLGSHVKFEENLTCLDIPPLDIVRFPPLYHGAFDSVKCLEKPISEYSNWPFVLDELLRLGSESCTFSILIATGDSKFSVAFFYKQIYKKSKGNCSLINAKKVNNIGGWEITFLVEKELQCFNKTWSFGVIWDGNGEGNLLEFIDSVFNQKLDDELLEVIICGPKIKMKYDVTFIEPPEEAEVLSNISQKKNLIVKNAKFENICIVHNRYKLDRNFISSFSKFGYDFELCVIPQVLALDGRRVPDWVSQASDHLLTKNYWLEYGEFSPFQYSPGGLTIAKKSVLADIPWNELATWNMAEDVELSQRLRDEGFVYKLNTYTTARVLSLRKEIISDFHASSLGNYYSNVDQFVNHKNKLDILCRIVNRLFVHYKKLRGFLGNYFT